MTQTQNPTINENHYSVFKETACSLGFEILYEGGDDTGLFTIFAHKVGMILSASSFKYQKNHLINQANLYYNLKNSSGKGYPTGSGHFNFDKNDPDNRSKYVWVGELTIHSGHSLTQAFFRLRKSGLLLEKWIESPFLWFITPAEYQEITNQKDDPFDKVDMIKRFTIEKYLLLPTWVHKMVGLMEQRLKTAQH